MTSVVILTFYNEKWLYLIKWFVYFQSLEMILSNFNKYKSKDLNNYETLNMLRTLYATMFVIYNTFVGNMMMETRPIMYYCTGSIWFLNIIIVIYSHFDFSDFQYEAIVQVILAAVYILVLIPAFLYVVNHINGEYLEEANLAYLERNNYRKMFDAL